MLHRLIALLCLLLAAPAAASPADAAGQRLAEPGMGLALVHPADWRVERPEPYTLILRPPATGALGFAAVTLRNLRRPPEVEAIAGPPAAVAQYLKEMRAGARGVTVLREAPFGWDIHHPSPAQADKRSAMIGHQVVAEFTRDEIPFRQWAVFLPSPLAPVVHAWLYTAPAGVFDQGLAEARAILDSLHPLTTEAAKP